MFRFLTQDIARQIDERLMGSLGFSIDQLMELAGLSVAQSVAKEVQPCSCLVVCGPGNNGGDGLVAARHLKHFGFAPEVLYPKRTDKELYSRLVLQCEILGIPILTSIPELGDYKFVLDAIFGFSFSGEIRTPFDLIIRSIKESSIPVISIDIPSGWNVERGNTTGEGLEPQMLISLTAPKLCAQSYEGIHYLGGRFIPPVLLQEYRLEIPNYPQGEQCVRIDESSRVILNK